MQINNDLCSGNSIPLTWFSSAAYWAW